jgi:hypothetical protein
VAFSPPFSTPQNHVAREILKYKENNVLAEYRCGCQPKGMPAIAPYMPGLLEWAHNI